MKLKKFIKNYVEPNTLIRLHYKTNDGHVTVSGKDVVKMEHQLVKGEYKNRKVVGVTDILHPHSHYPEAVNLVIGR